MYPIDFALVYFSKYIPVNGKESLVVVSKTTEATRVHKVNHIKQNIHVIAIAIPCRPSSQDRLAVLVVPFPLGCIRQALVTAKAV